jgi:hypothetical protein
MFKPARNALAGYTYQQKVAFYFLTLMDVEREIKKLTIEANVDHNFDDLYIETRDKKFYCQMKDYLDIKLTDITIKNGIISIKGSPHTLSTDINVIFIKDINIKSTDNIFGIPCTIIDNVYIISISRLKLIDMIDSLYLFNDERISIINRFFENKLDKRSFEILISELPNISVFSTKLTEETIKLIDFNVEENNILIIEGKPGVGKSHLVNQLEYKNNKILYRFWVSNQDKDYNLRLQYDYFLRDLSKKVFQNQKMYYEDEIIKEVIHQHCILIIDGFDHVENYANKEVTKFINFFKKFEGQGQLIILTRPLSNKLNYITINLENWNEEQTRNFLQQKFHFSDYYLMRRIYRLTNGYPILVNFLANHYNINNDLPKLNEIHEINDYYDQVFNDIKIKTALSLFITSRSFFIKSEINNLVDNTMYANILSETIENYPYIFEIKGNRVSLIHDSVNTFLKHYIQDTQDFINGIHDKVYKSILKNQIQYLSRFYYFDFNHDKKINIAKKYSNIKLFNKLPKKCIDYEALQEFYLSLRYVYSEASVGSFTLSEMYNYVLIYNIITRNHISNMYGFLYTYINSLKFHCYSIDDITSSGYLFGMFLLMKTNDWSFLKKIISDDGYDIRNIELEILGQIKNEKNYFKNYNKPLDIEIIKAQLKDGHEYQNRDLIIEFAVNAFIHDKNKEFNDINSITKEYLKGNKEFAVNKMINLLEKYNVRGFFANSVLNSVLEKLYSLGKLEKSNDYLNLSLKNYLKKHRLLGSFILNERVANYLRLSIKDKRKIDIKNIAYYFRMYYNRKDYSLVNIDVALTEFENLNKIKCKKSIGIIRDAMEMSEKGIRQLLNDYIKRHSTNIIKIINKNFDLEDLSIIWLELGSKFIDSLDMKIFEEELFKLFRYNRHNKKLKINEVLYILQSKKKNHFLEILEALEFQITIEENDPLIKIVDLKYLDIQPASKENFSKSDPLELWQKGILTKGSRDIILHHNLQIEDIAKSYDGWYSHLNELDLFDLFDRKDVAAKINLIIHYAIIGDRDMHNSYGNLYYLIGNVPAMLRKYNAHVNWNKIHRSFKYFIKISILK